MVSNLLSSPASGEIFQHVEQGDTPLVSFQFIEFPSEWGVVPELPGLPLVVVSNLLSSPASGEGVEAAAGLGVGAGVSNLLSSPASGE